MALEHRALGTTEMSKEEVLGKQRGRKPSDRWTERGMEKRKRKGEKERETDISSCSKIITLY